MKIYKEELLSQLAGNRQVAKFVKQLYDRRVYFSYLRSRRELYRLFDNHPITQEILRGPNAESQILSYGNLFSFIGFENESEPIKKLRKSIGNHTFLDNGKIRKIGKYYQITYSVTVELFEIYAENPLPWAEGLSWPERIETGLSNFGYYIAKENTGRSLGGVQAQKVVRSDVFNPQPYLSEIIEAFLNAYREITVSA